MTGTALVTEIINILTAGISGVATGVGEGLSTLASSIFFTTTEGATGLSVLGICIIAFAGISLALALCRLTIPGDIKSGNIGERWNANTEISFQIA